MTRWGMVIDLNRCVGCQTCVAACKHENATPPGVQWCTVLDVELGTFPDVQRLFMVTGCQHCEEPSCVPVCPTGATKRRFDGIVTMDYDRCIGCAACVVACPYQARDIVHERESYYRGKRTAPKIAAAHDERLGVANKCNFCVDRLDAGLAAGLTPGVDLAATPACAASCIASAIHFGDYADEQSNVSRMITDNQNFQVHEELGTDPQIRYLYDLPTTPGRHSELSDAEAVAAPLAGKQQTYWDYKGAINFVCGGLASGFAVMAFLLEANRPKTSLSILFLVAAVIMAVGLGSLLFKIGRPTRALLAALQPGTSWMSRELWVAATFFPLVALGLVLPDLWVHDALGVVAALFLICQARILYASKGIPAWRAPLIPWMLVMTGLFEGIALYAIVELVAPKLAAGSPMLLLLGIALAITNAILWHRYRVSAADRGIGQAARSAIAKITPWLHLVCHALPIALFGVALFVSIDNARILAGVGSVAVIAGGAGWKFWVILRAGHQQGFALPKMPQRGSGGYAAPPRLKVA